MHYSGGVLFGVEAGLREGVEAGVETGARVGVGAGAVIGVVMLMFSFFVPLPKIRSRNTNNKMASTTTRKCPMFFSRSLPFRCPTTTSVSEVEPTERRLGPC